MAVTILRERSVCDGYDARVRLGDGKILTFHLPVKPADTQTAVDALEANLLAIEQTQIQVVAEDGTVV
jgi:hypothetical protein